MFTEEVNVEVPVSVVTLNEVQVLLSIWCSCGLVLAFVQRRIVCV